MIQRQQTLWLLLSVVCAALSFEFPFYSGSRLLNGMSTFDTLDGGSNLYLVLLTAITLLVGLVAIFLYKDRKTQLKTAWTGIVLSLAILAVYINEIRKFEKGTLAIHCVYIVGLILGFIMAARGIRKDEKLVKSLDKLR